MKYAQPPVLRRWTRHEYERLIAVRLAFSLL